MAYLDYNGLEYFKDKLDDTYETIADANDLKSAINDLGNDLGKYKYDSPSTLSDWKNIDFPANINQGDVVYIKTFPASSVTVNIAWYLVGGTSQTVVANDQSGKEYYLTAPQNVDYVRVSYHLPSISTDVYSAVIINTTADNAFGYIADVKHAVELNKIDADNKFATVDTPFAVNIDNKFKGIVGFEFLITGPTDASYSAINNQQYRVTNIYYKDAFYLYMSVERYYNGAWSGYDSVTILLADAPTETGIMYFEGTYKRFRVAIIPGLMQAGRAANVEYLIKNTAVNPFLTKIQSDVDKYVPYDSFGMKDTIANRVIVKKDGTGDFATIADAYNAIKDKSNFFNQYEVCVYPGTYNEINLVCPPYSHTHGMFPNTVIVTSEGETGTLPVFDQKSFPSKLSNMKIVSATGYCIHIDNPLIHSVVNRGLYCKKIYATDVSDFGWKSISTAAIIGMGAQPSGMNVIFDGCVFEDGAVTCHSASSADNNADYYLALNNCTLINAQFQLNKAVNTGASIWGNLLCEINNLKTAKGQSEPGIWLTYGEAVTGLPYNFGWQIIGGDINTAIGFYKFYDSSAPDCWENICLTEKSYIQAKATITKGQWVTDGMIPATANEKAHNIIGVALSTGSAGDTIPVWVGNAYRDTSLTDGEYGTDASGALSSVATEKIGKVINNIFYRY